MEPTAALEAPDAFNEEAEGPQLAKPQDPEGPKATSTAHAAVPASCAKAAHAAESQAATAGICAADRSHGEEATLVSVACNEVANAAKPQAARADLGKAGGRKLQEAAAALEAPAEAASAIHTAETLAAGAHPESADEARHKPADHAPVSCADLRHATSAEEPHAIAAKPNVATEPARERAASCVAVTESAHAAAGLQTQADLAASKPVEELKTGKAAPAAVPPVAALDVITMEPQAMPDSTGPADAPEAVVPLVPVARSDVAQDVDLLEVHDRDGPEPQAMPACAALADGAPSAAQPQGAPPMSADMPLKEAVAAEHLALAAEKHGILWARVKGFPHWPVRLVSLSVKLAIVLHPDWHIIATGKVGLQDSRQDRADSTWRVKDIKYWAARPWCGISAYQELKGWGSCRRKS